jgi:hypothetical protein
MVVWSWQHLHEGSTRGRRTDVLLFSLDEVALEERLDDDRGIRDEEAQPSLDFTRCRAFYIAGKPRSRLECLEKLAERVERRRPLDERELSSLGAAACDAGAVARGLLSSVSGRFRSFCFQIWEQRPGLLGVSLSCSTVSTSRSR